MVFQHGKSQLIRWKISGDPFRGPVIPDHLQRSIQSLGRRFPRDAYHRHRIHLWHHDGHIYRHRIAFFQLLVSPVFDNVFSRPALRQRFPQLFDRDVAGRGLRIRTQGRQCHHQQDRDQDAQVLFHMAKPPRQSGRTASLLSLSIMTKPGGNRFTEQKIFFILFPYRNARQSDPAAGRFGFPKGRFTSWSDTCACRWRRQSG